MTVERKQIHTWTDTEGETTITLGETTSGEGVNIHLQREGQHLACGLYWYELELLRCVLEAWADDGTTGER